jgi:hypothetical protein
MANRTEKSKPLSKALGMVALVGPLIVILAAAAWFAARSFTSINGPPLPMIGYVAMAGGVIVSVLVGCALMTLLFYSSRHGYDEPPQANENMD